LPYICQRNNNQTKNMEHTLEEYLKRIAEIDKKAEMEKTSVVLEFARANNPYKEGDIVSDGTNTIRVTRMKVTRGWGNVLPFCYYYGVELKKDGTPKVRQSGLNIAQTNIVKI
jgi:hypothetical protein